MIKDEIFEGEIPNGETEKRVTCATLHELERM